MKVKVCYLWSCGEYCKDNGYNNGGLWLVAVAIVYRICSVLA